MHLTNASVIEEHPRLPLRVFLDHFGLSEIRDLPGMEELKGAGLLSSRMPAGFSMPLPSVDPDELTEEEEELTDIDLEELGLLTPKGGDD